MQSGFCYFDPMVDPVKPYVLARYHEVKRPYIVYRVWSEEKDCLVIRKVFAPAKFSTPRERKTWANNEIPKINKALIEGKYIRIRVAASPNVGSTITQTPTLLEFFTERQKTRANVLRPKAAGKYKSVLNTFTAFLKEKGLSKIKPQDFTAIHAQQYQDYLIKKGLAAITINNYRDKMGWFFKQAVKRELILKNPWIMDNLPETQSYRNIAFSNADQETMEKSLLNTLPGLYLFTRMIYLCFLRPKELRQLRIINIDFYNRTVIVPGEIGKNRKTQAVPIPAKLFELLKDYKEYPPTHYLFSKNYTPGISHLSENTPYNMHRRVLENLGLDTGNYTLYSWKHTGAVRALQAGINIKVLQRLLRHSSLEETDVYLKSLGIHNDELTAIEW